MFKKSMVSSFHCRSPRVKPGLVIVSEECGQNNTVHCSIIPWKQNPARQHGASKHLIERLEKSEASIHQLGAGPGEPKNGCDAPSAERRLIDFCQHKSLEGCARIPQAFGKRVGLAVSSLSETLASKPPLFSCCKSSQESQVVIKHVLIDNFLSPRHFALRGRHNEEKHVRAAERNLGAERAPTLRDCK